MWVLKTVDFKDMGFAARDSIGTQLHRITYGRAWPLAADDLQIQCKTKAFANQRQRDRYLTPASKSASDIKKGYQISVLGQCLGAMRITA